MSTNLTARDGAGISQSGHDRLFSGSTPACATNEGGDAQLHRQITTSHAAPTVQAAGAASKYNRVGQLMIRPLVMRGEHSAFDLARLFYAQYSDLHFESDLIDYMRNGFVTVRPNIFGMFKAIHHEGERIWYIRIAVGNLLELLGALPFMLPKFAFCRNNHGDKMVVVDAERLIEVAKRGSETMKEAA